MEAVNLGAPCEDCAGGRRAYTSAALHFGGLPPRNTYLTAEASQTSGAGPHEEWRTYTVEWGEGVIQWFVDDELFLRLTDDDWFTEARAARGRDAAPFDQPFYLMANLAVGGRWPEGENLGGVDADAFPAELKIDWVRVEQCAGDAETGRACLSQAPWSGEVKGP